MFYELRQVAKNYLHYEGLPEFILIDPKNIEESNLRESLGKLPTNLEEIKNSMEEFAPEPEIIQIKKPNKYRNKVTKAKADEKEKKIKDTNLNKNINLNKNTLKGGDNKQKNEKFIKNTREYHTFSNKTPIKNSENSLPLFPDDLRIKEIKLPIVFGPEQEIVLKQNENKPIVSNFLSEGDSRGDFLKAGSIIASKIKELFLEFKEDSTEKEKAGIQKRLERLGLDYEREFLTHLMSNLDTEKKYNTISQQIIRDWELNLNNAISNFIQPYLVNNYHGLILELKKGSSMAEFILLSLAILLAEEAAPKEVARFPVKGKYLKDGSLINIILSIIIRLLVSPLDNQNKDLSGKRQGSLIMDLSNQLLRRAPSIFPVLNLLKINKVKAKDSELITKFYSNRVLNMSEESKAVIGNIFLELILSNVDVLTRSAPIYEPAEGKRYCYISITDVYKESLIVRSFNPLLLPMIVRPKEWKLKKVDNKENSLGNNYEDGGYYTAEMRKAMGHRSFIHQNYKNLRDSIVTQNQADTINYLNNQKYKINKLMLDFLLSEFNNEDSVYFKGCNKLHPLTNNINHLKINEKKKVSSHNSKYFLIRNILEIALIFENIPFYLPNYMDFRGRIYPYPSYLEYQGSDTARCLIEFAKGCSLDEKSLEAVFHFLANTAGKKLTLKNKYKWANTFLSSLDLNPLIDKTDVQSLCMQPAVQKVINSTDEPGQFLSALTSLIKFYDFTRRPNGTKGTNESNGTNGTHTFLLNNETESKFHTPICFDATCSGIQHLSALSADIDLGVKSNVIGTDEDCPQDVYTEIANFVIMSIQELDDPLRSILSKIIISREFVKPGVMTIPYNVGIQTMTTQMIERGYVTRVWDTLDNHKSYYYIINPKFVKSGESLILTNSQMGKFTNILHKSLYNKYPSLKSFKDYLDKLIRLILKLNRPITWITPAGMIIRLSYRQFSPKSIKNFYSKKRGASISLPITSLDYKANMQGFMPNFIHSMDGANIQILIEKLKKKHPEINLFTIHDCFATTPNFMRIVDHEVKLSFIQLYFNSHYIKEMHNNFLRQIASHTQILEEDVDEKDKKNKYIIVNNEKLIIPDIPNPMLWGLVQNIFIKGIERAHYFIS